jgi:hypothetical protein
MSEKLQAFSKGNGHASSSEKKSGKKRASVRDSASNGAAYAHDKGVYMLSERQFEKFKACITSEREPSEKIKEAARRHRALVISK